MFDHFCFCPIAISRLVNKKNEREIRSDRWKPHLYTVDLTPFPPFTTLTFGKSVPWSVPSLSGGGKKWSKVRKRPGTLFGWWYA